MSKTQYNLLDIPELPEVHKAFTSYVFNKVTNIPLANMFFTPCDVKLGKVQIKYRSWLSAEQDGNNYVLEFFITFKDDKPMAMIQRSFVNDELEQDSIGFTQYEHISFNLEGVLKLITDLPQQDAVIYHGHCPTCIEKKH